MSLDVKDPHKEFLDRLIKSILGVIPGLGFFQKWLLTNHLLLSLNLGTAKSLDRRSDSHGSGRSDSPSTSSDHLSALLALPNTHARSLHGVLTAEGASIATRHTRMRGPTCCAGRSQSSSQSYAEKNHISFRTFRKFQPS